MTQITLAEWLSRSLRDEEGRERMTMVALEAKSRVGRSTLYRIRDGFGPVGEKTIKAIAHALDVPVPEVVQMVELGEQRATVFDYLDQIRELARAIETMLADNAAETLLAAILDRGEGTPAAGADVVRHLEALVAKELQRNLHRARAGGKASGATGEGGAELELLPELRQDLEAIRDQAGRALRVAENIQPPYGLPAPEPRKPVQPKRRRGA